MLFAGRPEGLGAVPVVPPLITVFSMNRLRTNLERRTGLCFAPGRVSQSNAVHGFDLPSSLEVASGQDRVPLRTTQTRTSPAPTDVMAPPAMRAQAAASNPWDSIPSQHTRTIPTVLAASNGTWGWNARAAVIPWLSAAAK